MAIGFTASFLKKGDASFVSSSSRRREETVSCAHNSLNSSSAFEQQFALSCVACERRGAFEFFTGFVGAAELDKQIAAHAREQVIVAQRRLRCERVDELEPGLWSQAIATATARFSSTTGDGVRRASSS